jgi:hypothetical protein
MLDGTYFFECRCGSNEHILRFTLDIKDPENREIYTSIFLNQYRSIFKRIWIGIKYIFGYKCRFGHWDCWILKEEDTERLRDMCDKFIYSSIKYV